MNLFMVLIPFLLLTAVFVKTTVIEVHLPEESTKEASPDALSPEEILTISLTSKGFIFSGLGKNISDIAMNPNDSFNFELLSIQLQALKDKHPKSEEVILLFNPNTSYALVVQMMDTTREVWRPTTNGGREKKVLFPNVSVGEISTELQRQDKKALELKGKV
jgi:biopolymer transport protein ExbD